jgi:hypothetical protein
MTKKDLFSYLVCLILIIVVLVWNEKYKDETNKENLTKKEEIKKHLKLTSGLVTRFNPSHVTHNAKFSNTQPSSVKFTFCINQDTIIEEYSSGFNIFYVPIEDHDFENKHFLVVYDSLDPKNAILLFNNPINEKITLDSYILMKEKIRINFDKILDENERIY